MNNYFDVPQGYEHLKKMPNPLHKYNDGSAWMMSEMSGLAYACFDPPLAMASGPYCPPSGRPDKNGEQQGEAQQEERKPVQTGVLKRALAEVGFSLVETFDNDHTQAFLAKHEEKKIAVLAFRGSDEVADWRTNFNISLHDAGAGVKIHVGFYKAYQDVVKYIHNAMATLSNEGYSFYITGHSKGGALALIATWDLKGKFPNSADSTVCYTFGCSRVGNKKFREKIEEHVYRIVNDTDWVPLFPLPKWVLRALIAIGILPRGIIVTRVFGYKHVGAPRYLTKCKKVDCSDVELKDKRGICAYFKIRGRTIIGLKRARENHRIDEYRKKLQAYAKKQNPPPRKVSSTGSN